jgi:hypothetical protein
MTFTEAELAQPVSKRHDMHRYSHQLVPGSPYFAERVEKCLNEMDDVFDFLYAQLAHVTGQSVDEVRREMESPPKRRRQRRRRPRKSSTGEKSGAVSETAGKVSAPANAPANTSKMPGKGSGDTSGKVSNAPGNTSGKTSAPKKGQQGQRTQGNEREGNVKLLVRDQL